MKPVDHFRSPAAIRRWQADIGLCPSRRSVLMALSGFGGMAMIPVRAQQNSRRGEMYFVPGGRIGFRKPAGIDVSSSLWRLQSKDGVFEVAVREGVPRDEHPWWDRLNSRRVATRALDGFEVRYFRMPKPDPGPNFAEDYMVVWDAGWIGEVRVSYGIISLPPAYRGGLDARWKKTMEAIFSSIVIRPRLAIADALDELDVSLDTTGLNPRLIGGRLILSLDAPSNLMEVEGAGEAVIQTSELTNTPTPDLADRERYLAMLRQSDGSRVLTSSGGRGVLQKEYEYRPDRFRTRIIAFGRTRHVELAATYQGKNRDRTLDALHHVFQTLTLRDFP